MVYDIDSAELCKKIDENIKSIENQYKQTGDTSLMNMIPPYLVMERIITVMAADAAKNAAPETGAITAPGTEDAKQA